MIHLFEMLGVGESMEAEYGSVVAYVWVCGMGLGKCRVTANGNIALWGVSKCFNLDWGDDCKVWILTIFSCILWMTILTIHSNIKQYKQ